jgi:PAS domain S-box-containing protein
MRFTIRTKLTVIIVGFVLIPLAFLGSHIYHVANVSLQERIGQSLRVQASAMVEQIDRMLFERYRNVQGWAEEDMMIGIVNDDADKRISGFLTTLKKQYGLYEDIVAADNSGKIAASSNPNLIGKSVSEELWFRKISAEPEILASVQTGSKFMQNYGAIFAAPVVTEAILNQIKASAATDTAKAQLAEALEAWNPKTLGIVAAWINWTEIIEFINSIPVMEGQSQSREAYAVLMSKEGLVLSQPVFEDRAVIFREDLVKAGMKAAAAAAKGESGYTVEDGRYGETTFIAYASSKGYRDFKGFGWSILIFQSADKALAPIRKLRYQVVVMAVVMALAAALMAVLLATGVSRPIEKLAEFTRAIGRGDLSASVPVGSKDEVGMLAFSFNEMITNLKKARTDITSARDFTDNIIKSIGDALIVLDTKGRIQTFNPALRKILGFEEKELTGLSLDRLFTKESQADSKLLELLQLGQVSNMEAEVLSKDGTVIPMLFSSTALRDGLNQPQGAVVIARDMREYKSLQSKFLEAQKMDAVGRLAGGVAHDFNNMLTVINGYSEDILIGRGKAELIPKKVGEVLKAGRRSAKLVGQLLSFSRRQTSKPMVLDMNQLIQGLDKMLKLITTTRIEIVELLAHDLWPVKLDPGQFEQVLTNLSVNARDAMPEGGKLIIETKNAPVEKAQAMLHEGIEPGDFVLLEVRDTGTGMTEEVKKRIFEPFFTTKPKGKGTGLGLATCFDFVRESKGFIEVHTELGKGTAFKIFFPKAEGKPQNVLDQEIVKKPSCWSKMKIWCANSRTAH